MFSKILVGFAGITLLGIGGFFYWDHHNCPSRCNRGSCSTPVVKSCCLQSTGTVSTSSEAEDLTVMPREVPE